MYHKILDEALQELKETEFRELFREDRSHDFVKDCQIETDLEILIPGDYISNTTERLIVYKELDSIETEEILQRFRDKLTDRFGPIPGQTLELIDTIRLRWLARKVGFEKIVLKNERMIGYFPSNPESDYYQSGAFSAVISFVQKNPSLCRMKESEKRLSLTFRNVSSVSAAIRTLKGIDME